MAVTLEDSHKEHSVQDEHTRDTQSSAYRLDCLDLSSLNDYLLSKNSLDEPYILTNTLLFLQTSEISKSLKHDQSFISNFKPTKCVAKLLTGV